MRPLSFPARTSVGSLAQSRACPLRSGRPGISTDTITSVWLSRSGAGGESAGRSNDQSVRANVGVVTAGFDPARFPWPDAAMTPPREPWAEGRKVLCFAGLIHEPMKGFAVLHDAARRLWSRRKDFVLIATGDPAGQVDEFTRLIGWQSQDDLPRHLRAADVVVFPTIAQEALGRTAVEAMAAGRPVVASRIGGLTFTVADGATGLLCEPGDPDDLARKLETLLDDPDLRTRMGRAGRRRFEEHYSWDVIIEKHYKPLLKHRPRDRDPLRADSLRGYRNPFMETAKSTTGQNRSEGGFTPELPPPIDRVKFLEQVRAIFLVFQRSDRASMAALPCLSRSQGLRAHASANSRPSAWTKPFYCASSWESFGLARSWRSARNMESRPDGFSTLSAY